MKVAGVGSRPSRTSAEGSSVFPPLQREQTVEQTTRTGRKRGLVIDRLTFFKRWVWRFPLKIVGSELLHPGLRMPL